MIKVIGFNAGAVGDLVMMTALTRQFKKENSDSYFIFGIGNRYAHIVSLFYNHSFIDDIHIWSSYDEWPVYEDIKYIIEKKIDKVYNAMPDHFDELWYNKRHYIQEHGLIHGFSQIDDLTCILNPYFGAIKDCDKVITLSMFPQFDKGQKKSLSLNKLEELCLNIKKLGFLPIQLGGKYEQKLENAEKPDFSMLEAARLLYSSRLHITADTSFSWISSSYKHLTIGVYTNNLPYMIDSWSHRPINSNAYYFHRDNLENLAIEEIIIKIKELI